MATSAWRRLLTVLACAAVLLSVLGVAPASAASSGGQTLRLTTASALRQNPENFSQFREVGGVVLRLPGVERLGRLNAIDRTDFSNFPCEIIETRDTFRLRFSATDTLVLSAQGSAVAPPGCRGFRYHRALAFTVTGGTGAFEGARGNGTASGELRTTPTTDFATVTMTWTGVLYL